MTALAIDLLREVSEAGGTVRLEGAMLRLSAPEPLPDDLRDATATAQGRDRGPAGGSRAGQRCARRLPSRTTRSARTCRPRWPTASGAILAAEGAQGVPPNRWPQIQRDTRQLVERRWLHTALDLGWSTADLFGCDQRAPWHRLDRSGLVLLMGGHEIVELSSDVATLRTRTGSVLRHRRRPPAKPPVALLWEVLTSRAHPTGSAPAEATGPPIRGPTAHRSEEADGGDVLGRTPPPS